MEHMYKTMGITEAEATVIQRYGNRDNASANDRKAAETNIMKAVQACYDRKCTLRAALEQSPRGIQDMAACMVDWTLINSAYAKTERGKTFLRHVDEGLNAVGQKRPTVRLNR